jgi:two-component system phosphate regulon sensor histidine kinase PhoR
LTVSQLKKISTDKSKSYLLFFRILEASIKKMQLIITELTDPGKLKVKYKVEAELLQFEDILDDVRLTLAGIILESGAKIETKINVLQITYSRRKLRSIVYNLVNNAIKFQSPGKVPEILISTKKDEKFIVISVKDNGIGIDKSKQKEVFSKYIRVGNNVEGTGVGLYLVNEIVANSGGKIILQSELGKGSEFKVYLPLK